MQRRAAAIYFALFLVIGAGSYGLITVVDAQKPEVSLDAPKYSQGDVIEVDGRTYTVAEVTAEEESGGGGGHGGGGETTTTMVGSLTWTNQSARASVTLENGSMYDATWTNGTTAPYQNASWLVQVENTSTASTFTLQEPQNLTSLIATDPAVSNSTVTSDGQEYVVYPANGSQNRTLVPVSTYLDRQPDPVTYTFQEGETFVYNGSVNATIADVTGNVSTPSVTLVWTTSKTTPIELTEGANVTLNGQQRVVHFPSKSKVQLSTDIAGYQNALDRQDYFHERKNGLWGITIISSLAAIILLATAYLPVKD